MNDLESSQGAGSGGVGVQQEACGGWSAFLRRHRWVGFVLPFVVYMGVGAMEPIRTPLNLPSHPISKQFPDQGNGPQVEADVHGLQFSFADPFQKGTMQAADAADSFSTGQAENPTKAAQPSLSGQARQPNSSEPSSNQGKSNAPVQKSPLLPEAPPPPLKPLSEANWAGITYAAYPAAYTLKILLTCLALGLVWPVYREFPLRMSLLAVVVGVGGLIIWLGFGGLNLERKWLEPIGLGRFLDLGVRSEFDPFRVFQDQPAWLLWGFVAFRLFGMVVVVPLVEEFFLRGFLMRYVMQADWWQTPVGALRLNALIACVCYAVVTHPAELFGATGWFLFVTLLAYKTQNIWDCVLAHATTNALLGGYILLLSEWKYW